MDSLDAAGRGCREVNAALAGRKVDDKAAMFQFVQQRFIDDFCGNGIEDNIRFFRSAAEHVAAEANR